MLKLNVEKIVLGIMAVLLLTTNIFAQTSGQKQVIVTLGSNVAIIDGKPTNLDAPPIIIKGKTMVPLRFIGEAFGAKVDWDNTTKSATLALNTPECPPCEKCPEPPIHNLAYVQIPYSRGSTASTKSTLFNLENGALNLGCSYMPGDESKLYSASVIISLKKEDGTIVNTFSGIGQKEREDYEKCKKEDKYGHGIGCFPITNETLIANLEKGNYYFEVTVLVDKPDHLWAAGIKELP